MKKLKFYFAILLGKTSSLLLKLIKRRLPYYPGYIALKYCPDFLNMVAKPKLIIAVTGTNGKSTICGILNDFFESQNLKVINNKGFNIETGIASMFLKDVTIFGKSRADIAIIEIDEKTTVNIFKALKPDYYLCSNLFRDSMRGNSNIDYTISKIKEGMPKGTRLLLNADDLITVSLGDSNTNNCYFGIKDEVNGNSIHRFSDLVYCPKCGGKLSVCDTKYFHIGNMKCDKCGYANPKRDYEASIEKDKLVLKHKKDTFEFPLKGDSIFNIYNYLASISLFLELGYSSEVITKFLSNTKLIKSRFSEEVIGNIKLVNHLAKGQNPVACSSVFEYAVKSNKPKAILLMLDDVMDRRDSSETIAWYYDTDFELFKDKNIKKIIVGGVRAYDVYVRLLMAGIDKKKIIVTTEEDMALKIPYKDIKEIYLLHDITLYDHSLNVISKIKEVGDFND